MPTTAVDIHGSKFLINGRETYAEIEGSRLEAHGLLMNARFIQAIFDDNGPAALLGAAILRSILFGNWPVSGLTRRLRHKVCR